MEGEFRQTGMIAALELYFKGTLPGIKGLNRQVNGATPAVWRDGGHLGAGMEWLEGYVFYATLYKKSPELIPTQPSFNNDALDKVFRKLAWQAVINNPLSDVTDKNGFQLRNIFRYSTWESKNHEILLLGF